jgi:hypothetical protein
LTEQSGYPLLIKGGVLGVLDVLAHLILSKKQNSLKWGQD